MIEAMMNLIQRIRLRDKNVLDEPNETKKNPSL